MATKASARARGRRQRRQRARRSDGRTPRGVRRRADSRRRRPPVRVVVVVPTYNEAENLDELVAAHPRAPCPTSASSSSTTTAPTARPSSPRSSADELGGVDVLVRGRPRRGLGSAYRDGFRRAIDGGADVVRADGRRPVARPGRLPALLANVEHGADLAIGSRYVPGRAHRELVVAAALAVAVGQPLRRRRARAGRQRRHRRVTGPTAPTRCERDGLRDGHAPRATASRSR